MVKYEYQAIKIRESGSGNYLVLFAAPATDIDRWAGVPQKKEIGGQETTGFQREVNRRRLNSLKSFFLNQQNIIQNPLLCAKRATGESDTVIFVPDQDENDETAAVKGRIAIEAEDLMDLPLLDLMKRVQQDIEQRVPDLKGKFPSDEVVRDLKQRAEIVTQASEQHPSSEDQEDESDAETEEEEGETNEPEDVGEVMFSQESHIYDFWTEIAARVRVLEELNGSFREDTFLEYSKDAMVSFLRPIVLVDGQHRLRGAIEAKNSLLEQDEIRSEIEKAIDIGEEAESVQQRVEQRISRVLPISLLMSTDPAEHVFQFVVVNQRATPIGRALLGTIVSTSLSDDELQRVSERLDSAGIPLESSRAVAYLTRNPQSPFFDVVEKGYESDKDLLPWTVLVSLLKIFRDLKGGRLFHEKVDNADTWRRKYLEVSAIVADCEKKGFATAYDCWKQPDGVWREVFMFFWRKVREEFASGTVGSHHYWGSPRQSNIFNKVYLTILAADFFAYLCGRQIGIDSVDQVPSLVDEWTDGVSRDYFNRDWKLEGVKKDTTGIRKQWAKLWTEYRKDPQKMPKYTEYRKPLAG